jgi:hypothetical protein
MSDGIRKAVHYRNCVEAVCFIASQTGHEEHKQALHRGAQHFHDLPEAVEQQAGQQG